MLTMFTRIREWLTLADYENAKAEASEQIVKRLSRNNVSAQNGWYMSDRALDDLSEAADGAMRRIQRHVPNL